MPDLKLVARGLVMFFTGFLLTVIGWYILPLLEDFMINDLNKAIFYIGLITLSIVGMIILPANYIMRGLKQDENPE